MVGRGDVWFVFGCLVDGLFLLLFISDLVNGAYLMYSNRMIACCLLT